MSEFAQSLAALRSDPALQRRSQAAVETAKAQWLLDVASQVATDIKRYTAGRCLADCETLARVMVDCEAAMELLSPLIGTQCDALGSYPLAHIPFRHQYQDGIAVLRLMEEANAALSLVMYERTSMPAAETVCFSDNECAEIVLAGKGEGRRLAVSQGRTSQAAIHAKSLYFAAGTSNRFDGADVSKMIDRVDGCLVILRLTRTPDRPANSREYRLDDGSLVHCATGERQTSRQEMALALLGAMKRGDACDEIEALAMEKGNPNRWEALRQLLALDTAHGFACLTRIADDRWDSLASQAGTLKARLLRIYPELNRLEAQLCPA